MVEPFPRRVIARRRPALGFWAWLIAGVALVACAAGFRQAELTWLAAWPLSMAGFLAMFREPRFEMEVAENSLTVNEGGAIAFDSILRVKALTDKSKSSVPSPSFPILVRHAAGQFIIPAKLDLASSELLKFLQTRAPAFVLELDTRLHEFLSNQERQFGDLVAIYVGEHAVAEKSYWGLIKAVLATSLVCSFVGFGGYASPWGNDGAMILGVISFATFAVTGLMSLVSTSHSLSSGHVETAGLVLSPGGLAMIQGELAGELRWEEIRNAKLTKGAVPLGRNKQFRGACIQVVVEGATILIADIYHEPVSNIYASIQRLRSV